MGFFRKAVTAALVAAVPVSTATAAVRPASAVPTAAVAATAQGEPYDDQRGDASWIALAAVSALFVVLFYLAVNDGAEAMSDG